MIKTDGQPTIATSFRTALHPTRTKPATFGADIPSDLRGDEAWPLRRAVDGLHLPDLGGINVGRDGRPKPSVPTFDELVDQAFTDVTQNDPDEDDWTETERNDYPDR